MKPGYEEHTRGLVERHLVPHFGARDLRELREEDLLAFVQKKLERASPRPRSGARSGRFAARARGSSQRAARAEPRRWDRSARRRVAVREARETRTVEAWSAEEARTLLEVAVIPAHEPPTRSAVLLGRDAARGGARAPLGGGGLQPPAHRGAPFVSKGRLGSPKSGRVAWWHSRRSRLRALRPPRRAPAGDPRARLARGAPWVFCSETGGLLDERNVERAWYAIRAGRRSGAFARSSSTRRGIPTRRWPSRPEEPALVAGSSGITHPT